MSNKRRIIETSSSESEDNANNIQENEQLRKKRKDHNEIELQFSATSSEHSQESSSYHNHDEDENFSQYTEEENTKWMKNPISFYKSEIKVSTRSSVYENKTHNNNLSSRRSGRIVLKQQNQQRCNDNDDTSYHNSLSISIPKLSKDNNIINNNFSPTKDKEYTRLRENTQEINAKKYAKTQNKSKKVHFDIDENSENEENIPENSSDLAIENNITHKYNEDIGNITNDYKSKLRKKSSNNSNNQLLTLPKLMNGNAKAKNISNKKLQAHNSENHTNNLPNNEIPSQSLSMNSNKNKTKNQTQLDTTNIDTKLESTNSGNEASNSMGLSGFTLRNDINTKEKLITNENKSNGNNNTKINSKLRSKSASRNASKSNIISLNLQDGIESKIDNKNDITSVESFSNDITAKLSNSLIYCRDREKEQILNFISSKDLKTLFICGQPGTGKTSLSLEILKNDLKLADNIIKIYINCMSVHSIEDFYCQILEFLFNNFHVLKSIADRKNLMSYKNILSYKKNLNKNFIEILELYKEYFTFLILLDEVDNFYQKQKEIIFYEILNTPYLTDTEIKIMLISNNPEFDKEILPKIESKKIKISRIIFQPYNHQDIYFIIKEKLSDIKILGIFQDEALRLISKKLANKMGDLRPAIEIVKNLILENKSKIVFNADGKIDPELNSENKLITLRDVLIKLKQKSQSFVQLMSNITNEQKIVLLSIYFIYEFTKNNELDDKLIFEKYKKIKRENFNSECNTMDYREIIKSFEDIGIIECRNKAKGKFKIKADLEDLEIIFVDDKIFNMFKSN